MHYLGLVILRDRTREALDLAMAPFHEETNPNGKWDWYRAGGRWDGWLGGSEEMSRRETDGGFNFDAKNDDVERNSCLVRDLPSMDVRFVLCEGVWMEPETFREDWEAGDDLSSLFVKNANYPEQLEVVKKTHPDRWAVVVDIHS